MDFTIRFEGSKGEKKKKKGKKGGNIVNPVSTPEHMINPDVGAGKRGRKKGAGFWDSVGDAAGDMFLDALGGKKKLVGGLAEQARELADKLDEMGL